MSVEDIPSFSEFPAWKSYFEQVDNTLHLCTKMEYIADWLDGLQNDGAIHMAESPIYIGKALKVKKDVAVKIFHIWRETIEQREIAGVRSTFKACISDVEREFPNCDDIPEGGYYGYGM